MYEFLRAVLLRFGKERGKARGGAGEEVEERGMGMG